MNDAELETILRAGPADEPIRARPLVLPIGSTTVVPLTTGPGRLRASRPDWLGALLTALVVLGGTAALAGLALRVGAPDTGAAGVGASPSQSATSLSASGRPAVSPTPDSLASGDLIQFPGFSLRAPAGWHVVALDAAGPEGTTLVALANFDLAGVCGSGATAVKCVAEVPLAPGQMLATVAIYPGPMDITDVEPPGGWSAIIDGMPAALQIVEAPVGTQVTGVMVQPGCDAHRAWWIGRPNARGWIDIEACSAGLDRSRFRALVDDLAAGVVFLPAASPTAPTTSSKP
jgi:hypothetical protein